MSDNIDLETDSENTVVEEEAQGIAMELLHDLKEHNRRMDDHNKRLVSALKMSAISFGATVIIVVGMFFFGMLFFLNQYEFENYSQDGGGYNNINTGEQGDLYNGAEISEDEKEERQSERNDSQEAVQWPEQESEPENKEKDNN